jgi:hypothetical protein
MKTLMLHFQVKAVKQGDGPKKELIESLRHFNQFLTAQEFQQVTLNILWLTWSSIYLCLWPMPLFLK